MNYKVSFDNLIENNTKNIPLSSTSNLFNEFTTIKNGICVRGYDEMNMFVKNTIYVILSMATNKDQISLRMITDIDYLTSMNNIIYEINLSKDYINKFNRIFRSYANTPEKNVIFNENVYVLFVEISYKLNKQLSNVFESLGIPYVQAIWLAVNRNSSTDERRNIRNLTRAIQKNSPLIMTEQMIINIFSKTFSDQLTNLFCTIMTDRFDTFSNDDEKYVYSTVSNSLLDILNTMAVDEIKDIIIEYENELHQSGVSYRFSLKAINSEDYKNICDAIDELHDMGLDVD